MSQRNSQRFSGFSASQIDWLSPLSRRGGAASPRSSQEALLSSSPSSSSIDEPEIQNSFPKLPRAAEYDIHIQLDQDRLVARNLGGYQLFMITVNATLGAGMYWRSGEILHQAGAIAVVSSYLVVGVVGCFVMQCIGELLCIWPIPGALFLFVGEFINAELGIVVGFMYWFAWTTSCAALVSTLIEEIAFWAGGQTCGAGLGISLGIPGFFIIMNSLPIKYYGYVEAFTGTIKLLTFVFTCGLLIAFASGFNCRTPGHRETFFGQWRELPDIETSGMIYPIAFIMSFSTSAFAYVGIEVIIASALEASWAEKSPETGVPPETGVLPDRQDGLIILSKLRAVYSGLRSALSALGQRVLLLSTETSPIIKTVKLAATRVPIVITGAYVFSGMFVTFTISQNDPRLPSITSTKSKSPKSAAMSPFVAIAMDCPDGSGYPWASAINAVLVWAALTCAMTNLYIASRTMFGILVRVRSSERDRRWVRIVAKFGKTYFGRVPLAALGLTAFVVYLLLLYPIIPYGVCVSRLEAPPSQSLVHFPKVLASMASVAVIIVWTCETAAFLRYYYCIKQHRRALENQKISNVLRWFNRGKDYPYLNKFQPLKAWFALIGCCMILLSNSIAVLWTGDIYLILSFWITPLVFGLAWLVVRYFLGGHDSVDLDNQEKAIEKIRKLNSIYMESKPVF